MINLLFNIFSSLVIKTIFNYLFPKVDVECYYWKYEQTIQKGKSAGWFFDWLFTEKDMTIFGEFYPKSVPYYRVFHASIGILYWLIAWFLFYQYLPWYVFAVDAVLGVAWAYYFMLYERKFYTIADIVDELTRYQRERENVYWLKRKWFYGYFCFRNEFLVWEFDKSAFIGFIGIYFTSIIYLIIYLI